MIGITNLTNPLLTTSKRRKIEYEVEIVEITNVGEEAYHIPNPCEIMVLIWKTKTLTNL